MAKVLTYIPFFSQGGIETIYKSEVCCFEKEECFIDHILLVHHISPSDILELKEIGVKVIVIEDIKNNPYMYIKNIREILISEYPDVVKTHNYLRSLFLLWEARKLRIHNRIYQARQHLSDNYIYRALNRINISLSSQLLTVSKDAGHSAFKGEKYVIIPNPVDAQKFRFNMENRHKIRKKLKIENKIVIGNVGRIIPVKNQIFLLEVLNQLPSKYCLIIIGEGPVKYEIIDKISSYELDDRVYLLGDVDASFYYSAFDVFAFPSKKEGFGNVVLESLVNGLKPIINRDMNSVFDENENVIKCALSVDEWISNIEKIGKTFCFKEENRGKSSEDTVSIYCEEMRKLYGL